MIARRQFVAGVVVFAAVGLGLLVLAGAFETAGLAGVAGVEALVVLGLLRASGRA